MSIEENVRIVKDFFTATGRGDRQSLLALCDDDIEWIIPGEDWPLAGIRRGHVGMADLFQTHAETMETSFMEPREFVAQGDRVMVTGFASGRIKSTNRVWEDHWVFAITVRNGKLTNIREYVDTQALARASDTTERGVPLTGDDACPDAIPTMLVVLQMAMQVEADPVEVASWYRDTGIAELGDLTAAQLVSLGKTGDVILFLHAIRHGERG
jgi:ketosteroid isomerase-like protein